MYRIIGGVFGCFARLIMPILALSDETMNEANSFTEILGDFLFGAGERDMDDILASTTIGNGRSICIATLSKHAIIENEAEHLGFEGYFLFETSDVVGSKGISILGKVTSIDAAFRMIDLWRDNSLGRQATP